MTSETCICSFGVLVSSLIPDMVYDCISFSLCLLGSALPLRAKCGINCIHMKLGILFVAVLCIWCCNFYQNYK